MQTLVTRFHLLLLVVTVAITGVGLVRIPSDVTFAAHWAGSTADWIWPRSTLIVAPLVQVALLVTFFLLGRSLTRNHYAKCQHILDPALTLQLSIIAATQFGLLLTGIGSDLDFIRFTAVALGATLVVLGIILFEAERHTYAGLRMPWPIRSDQAWRLVHRLAGIAFALMGFGLLALAWLDAGTGFLVYAFAAALYLPPLLAGVTTLALGER